MLKRFLKKLICLITKHKFVRFPLLDGNIQLMCSKCEKTLIKKRIGDSICEEYFNE